MKDVSGPATPSTAKGGAGGFCGGGTGMDWMERLVLRTFGRTQVGFTPRSRQADEGAMQAVSAAGFAGTRLLQLEGGFGVIAQKPGAA